MKTFAIAQLCAAIFFLNSQAWAESASDILGQIEAGKAELGKMEQRQQELVEKNESDVRLYKTYGDNHTEIEKRVSSSIEAFKADAARRYQSANGIVENWNSECAADRVGPLPEAQFNRCARLKPEVERSAQAIRQQIQNDGAEIDRQNKPLIDAMKRQEQAMNEISARVKQHFADWEKFKAAADAMRTRLQNLRLRLAENCAARRTDEDAHFCATIGFDRQSGSLPPLQDKDIKPPFSATPN